jgi:hypothetical protein
MLKIRVENWEEWEYLESEYTRNGDFKKTKLKMPKKSWKQLQEDKKTKRSGKKRKKTVLKKQQNKGRQERRK